MTTVGSKDQVRLSELGSLGWERKTQGPAVALDSGVVHNLDPYVTLGSLALVKKCINLYYHVSTTGSKGQLGRLALGSSAMKGQNRGLAAALDSGAVHNLDPYVTLGSLALVRRV